MKDIKKIKITKRTFIQCLSSLAYAMAPGFLPRNFDCVIKYVKEHFKDIEGFNDWCIRFEGTSSELEKLIKGFLMECQEFRQLNISQKRFDQGVREPEGGFIGTFVGHDDNGIPCSVLTPEEYCDFIDLDALCGNLAGSIIFECQSSESDCFLCRYAKEYASMDPSDCSICKTCLANPINKEFWWKYETHPLAEKKPSEMTEEELKITGRFDS